MVRIRFSKTGRKNYPLFRVVVVDGKGKRDGRFIERIGHYNPHQPDPAKKLMLNVERYRHWISIGAQPSDSLRRLMEHTRVLDMQEAAAETAPAPASEAKAKAKAKAKRTQASKKAVKPGSKK